MPMMLNPWANNNMYTFNNIDADMFNRAVEHANNQLPPKKTYVISFKAAAGLIVAKMPFGLRQPVLVSQKITLFTFSGPKIWVVKMF
jgi:GR25 family glycosyltransferase involved in LPS biosynthesis